MNMINSFNNSHVLQNIQCFNNIYIYYSCFDSSAYTYIHIICKTVNKCIALVHCVLLKLRHCPSPSDVYVHRTYMYTVKAFEN